MRLLDRYILKQVIVTCAGCVGFFVFLIATVNALKDLLGYLLAGQLAPESAIKLFLLLIPYVVMYALPMGMLLGVLLVLGRMSADSEIVAMRTTGQSLKRITAPIFGLAILGVVVGVGINFYYMPIARTVYHQEFGQMLRTNALRIIVPKTFVREFPGMVVYVSEKRGNYVKDIWLWRLDKQLRVTGFSHAETGRLELDEEKNELVFKPFQLSTERFDEKNPEDFSKPPVRLEAESASFRFSLSRMFGPKSFNRKLDWFTPSELEAAKQQDAKTMPPGLARDQRLMRYDMIIQNKASMALAVLILVLIAVPLGIKVSRRETSANFGVALLLALIYYFSTTVVVGWFDKSPELRPDLLVWVPNLIFIGVGLWLNFRVERT
ncbi:MAG: LptF/LptG family permease [Verrucomicrobia bacterium]|nr:LptF/LptG family permease [Verrucomicrobiota bacterium]